MPFKFCPYYVLTLGYDDLVGLHNLIPSAAIRPHWRSLPDFRCFVDILLTLMSLMKSRLHRKRINRLL